MKTAHHRAGKISEHFGGLGTVTREMVEHRARELAMINGRPPNDYTQEDWVQAKLEMMGDEAGDDDSLDGNAMASLTRWDEEPGTSGHHVENNLAPDEQIVAEHLVQEGVDEANHEQMLQGSRGQR